jgi:hypothetical protein
MTIRTLIARFLTPVLLLAFAFSLVPAPVVAMEGRSSGNSHAPAVSQVTPIDRDAPGEVHATYSIDHDFPPRPQQNDRVECVHLPLFCEWLAAHNVIAEEPIADSPVDQTSDREPGGGDNLVDQATSANRSVVGWNSASVSTLEQVAPLQPVQLEVPSLSISADIRGVGVNQDRSMEVPDDYNTVGWYRYGPVPGDSGSAAIAGHLDDYSGRSVFYDLRHVEIGAEITVSLDDGSERIFEVRDKVSYDSGALPSDVIFARDGDPILSLMTCGGSWDSSAGRYSETVVVVAVPV